ncbi:MAG: transglycosylase SLT domain-containing protein [Candidatus Aminicenantes bacterium]|nr:transglycosylase SLT domain-containing protein [Candidatus Aminicenantes bacterium]NIM82828.1 transglycosylase SLT domain-containing protein [Candidatus Aminicenantes bacterium]NIN22204.1 transglycosylase SLT domain-containing protein [Candidatus Aminicenantes bacterium]NIN45972.1 transglycosylase SLT domain-containing protein [Candidatus Aminicenantes bacterium]NIN88808.1 transglycosylase SLT domain-containing protein [Candidatus Aminicenantes bacterium]
MKREKIENKNFNLFHYILLLEFTLVFSFAASLVTLTIIKGKPGSAEDRKKNNYHDLYQNYSVLKAFLNLPIRTEPIQDPESEIDNPFIIDILKLKTAESYLEEKQYDPMGNIILKLDSKDQHPFIIEKKDKLYLKYLYFKKKYREFITQWEKKTRDRKGGKRYQKQLESLEFKLFLLSSYINTGNNNKAFAMFKELFGKNNLKRFEAYISKRTLSRFLRRLDENYWFKKFKFLAGTSQYSEFLREKKYVRAPQLINLFYAEFQYQQKQYQRCQRYLRKVTSEKLLSYKERIILKLNIRDDNTVDLFKQLDALKRDPAIYQEVLLDAASILLIKGEPDLSLDLYARYIDNAKYLQLLRSFISTLNLSLPIRDANYWKTLWLCAWIHYRKNNKEKARDYFKQGMASSITPYRIANHYWYYRLKKNPAIDLDNYPFTYYYIKTKQGNIDAAASLKSFIGLLNHKQEPQFKGVIARLQALVHYNLMDEAVDFIHWALDEKKRNLSISDRHTLMLIESIIYLRQQNLAMAFIRFRDNFACYRCVRLPQFLSRISLPVKYRELIHRYSAEHQVDRALVFSIIREESFFRPDAVSYADARGLMQLLLKTARKVAYPHGIKVSRRDLFDPETNIRFGIEYLKFLLNKYNGKWHLALAAYNAGDHRVDEWLQHFGRAAEDEFIEMIPFTATRNYVKNILRNYYYYKFYYGEGSN